MEGGTNVTELQICPSYPGQEVSMHIIGGNIFRNSTDEEDLLEIDPPQYSYNAPLAMLKPTDLSQQEILKTNHQDVCQLEHNCVDDDSDTDINDKVMSASVLNYMKRENITANFIPCYLTQSISHHDYISSSHFVQKHERMSENAEHIPMSAGEELIIEEAVEQEITTTSHSFEDEDIVRSKPLTAMYLQRKEVGVGEVGVGDAVYISNHKITTTKLPDSARFTLKPIDMTFDELNSFNVDDYYRTKSPCACSKPVSIYSPNTCLMHFKIDPNFESEKRSPSCKRSVEAILAASETIKSQDIASEVEVGTCGIKASTTKRERKKKCKKNGIDNDVEQIRKAATDVASTLKSLIKKAGGRKRKKQNIRLTLTKTKDRHVSTTCSKDDSEYENSPISQRVIHSRKTAETDGTTNVIYQCKYCVKQFKTREKVKVHTKIHTENRAFNCNICGSQYRRREHLIRHYRRHTNDRPYQCFKCDKSYMRAEHLKRHSYDHTGEKPFECPVCPKAFTRHDRLIKHSLVHDK